LNILIIEDEPVHAKALKKTLDLILIEEDTQITFQESLQEAAEIIQLQRVNLIFLDLNLFGESGFELLDQLPNANVSTIVVSGNTDLALTAYEYGVIDFVPKPVIEDRLRLALERYYFFCQVYNKNPRNIKNTNSRFFKNDNLGYTKTRLLSVDLENLLYRLNHLMEKEKIFLSDDLTLEKLAESVNLHPRQLSEYLNGHLNTTYNAFLHKYRINEAKKILIEQPNRSITDIGFFVGYKSLSSFYEAFKKETGMTATEIRLKHFPMDSANTDESKIR